MYCLLLVISDSALLPLSATGGGRKATPTVYQQLSYIKTVGKTMFCILQIVFPTFILHFQFSTFNFKSSARGTVAHRVYCTVTVIVTLDVLLSTSVTEYVTLYLPLRVVTTLPKTSIFEVISLPQVSTAVTPARA